MNELENIAMTEEEEKKEEKALKPKRKSSKPTIWRGAKNLYCEFPLLVMLFKVFALAVGCCFVLIVGLIALSGGMSLKDFTTQCQVWGLMLVVFETLALVGYYLWAWAQGGVDDWEYTMGHNSISGRKIAHAEWRLKMLRAIGLVLMLFPAKPGQKLAMRNLYRDLTDKSELILLSSVSEVVANKKKGKILLKMKDGSTAKDIRVPREDFDRILELINERMAAKKTRTRSKRTAATRKTTRQKKENEETT